ncbi:hypothetical protein [Cellulomonas carbonis]|uniref:Membrane protein n=1 Tax=Cellulomonas carbonis T26 TaxID=947969 RepID=A0A0A0BRC2_9CELL|nr:hypothetical protein [Cellulomonas carbonis]KGM10521.1 membrane protein [Cellulomonas carbonis T26]GGB93094.1 hypothetical protein GCM10010972_02210 [Cellulomonas carbonis]
MAARPDDADEPDAVAPRDDEQGTGPDPDDVDRRWEEIVADLRGGGDPRTWTPDPAVEEQEEHFEPPDPGPVLGGDPLLTMAWAVVVAVPALFLLALVAWHDLPRVVLQVAAAGFVAAVALLLWRMPDRRDDDGPGAVV